MKQHENTGNNSNVFIAQGAVLRGDIAIGEHSSIWFNAIVRTEGGSIVIGEGTNIQDQCTLHTDEGEHLHIGNYVTIGHHSIIHNQTIGDNTLIGMGSILLSGAQIGSNCIIGAGSLVTAGCVIPDGEIWFGSPARFRRKAEPGESEANRASAEEYIRLAKGYIDATV